MPILKKGLSTLARAQASLGGKQIRRSINEQRVKQSEVAKKIREASLPKTPERPDPGDKTGDLIEELEAYAATRKRTPEGAARHG
jgi:hypothetical protein